MHNEMHIGEKDILVSIRHEFPTESYVILARNRTFSSRDNILDEYMAELIKTIAKDL